MFCRSFRFWFEPSTPTNLGICRVLFYSALFLAYLTEDFSRWGAVSSAFWMPLPAFGLLHLGPVRAGALDWLQTLWRASLVLSAAGWHSTASMSVAAALGFYLLGLPHNFGHVYHFDALLVIALAVMACSRAGDAWSIDAILRSRTAPPSAPASHGAPRGAHAIAPSGDYTWPIRLLWTATALVFLAAGLSKLRHGGLEWVASSNLSIVLTSAAYHVSDADPISTTGLWIARHAWISRAVAFTSLTIELTFAAALFSRRARLILVPAAAAMLVGIRVLMGPTFGAFLLVNVFWVPWDTVWGRLRSRVAGRAATAPAAPRSLASARTSSAAIVATGCPRDDPPEESIVHASAAAGNVRFDKR